MKKKITCYTTTTEKAVIVTQINKLTSLFWLFTGNFCNRIFTKRKLGLTWAQTFSLFVLKKEVRYRYEGGNVKHGKCHVQLEL